MEPDAATIERIYADLRGLIARAGWAVLKILPSPEGGGYAYTVGLSKTFEHPEFVIAGFDLDLAHTLLNDLGTAVKSGRRFTDGMLYDRLVKGYLVAFRKVERPEGGPYSAARRFYREEGRPGGAFKLLQCVLPDAAGRFPWDEGCDPAYVRMQPALWAPDSRRPVPA